ncbi:MAG: dihydroorotase [Lachnospiraceae bacterium]|nr:dihydroorotase [Lachnospiraceae bacterium]
MIILKNGTVVDPASELNDKRDLVIDEEGYLKILMPGETGEYERSNAAEIIDCDGMIIGPGLTDIHVHFRDPGFTYKEDICTGAKAAARGGVTNVILMANTKPAVDSAETVEYVVQKGSETDINVYTCGTITKGLKGKELTDFDELLEAGAVGLTDDGIPILDEEVARLAMQEAAKRNVLLSFHEEDPAYIENNGVNRGKASAYYGIGGSDRKAEISMVERDIRLAIETGARINIQHISTAEAVELVRQGKKVAPDRIFAEATPHHIALTEDAVIEYGTNARMNPPLRTEEDRKAIISGIKDGTIDCIATDHAPHSDEEKAKNIVDAPSGIIGLETSLPISYDILVRKNGFSILQLFCIMSQKPAEMYGINAGKLAIDRKADLVVFDPNREYDWTKHYSKSFNTPFKNAKITGDIVMTFAKGKLIYRA